MIDYDIRAPLSEAEWTAYYQLRWQILRQPWGQPPGSEKDAHEHQAVHLGAFAGVQLLGIGRLHFINPRQAQIRYMATLAGYRRCGIGSAILAALEAEARKAGASEIVLNARNHCLDFYRHLDYETIGEGPTLFQSIQHTRMRKLIR